MNQITEKQFDSLVGKIYDTLVQAPHIGMGEMGECRDEAKRIVFEWMEEEKITVKN